MSGIFVYLKTLPWALSYYRRTLGKSAKPDKKAPPKSRMKLWWENTLGGRDSDGNLGDSGEAFFGIWMRGGVCGDGRKLGAGAGGLEVSRAAGGDCAAGRHVADAAGAGFTGWEGRRRSADPHRAVFRVAADFGSGAAGVAAGGHAF